MKRSVSRDLVRTCLLFCGIVWSSIAPQPGHAAGINLSWDDCGAAGTKLKSFACTTNTGAPFSMIASFVAPSGLTEFLGLTSALTISTGNGTPLPDWWKFGAGQCRGDAGMITDFNFTSGPFTCLDFYSGHAAGGLAYDVAFGGSNRARLRIQCAVPLENRGPLDSVTETYAFKVTIGRMETTGAGSCGGCDQPMSIALDEIQLFQPPELAFDPVISQPLDRAFVAWQAVQPEIQIASFTPMGGPVGTNVTVLGSHFAGASDVRFGGVSAAFVVGNDSTLNATVPQGAITGTISAFNVGSSDASDSIFIVAPHIQSFSPVTAPIGHAITIAGTNFTRTSSVTFNGTPSGFTVQSNNSINAVVPIGTTDGPITVTNPGGSNTSVDPFRIGPLPGPPSITSFSPTTGPPGTLVTVRGISFHGASLVTFGGVSGSFTVTSDSTLDAIVPDGAHTGLIGLTTPRGSATSAGVFIVPTPPSITSFSPTAGPPGTLVTVRGISFEGASLVTFGGVSGGFTVTSDTTLEAIVPDGARTGRIGLTTPRGSATSAGVFIAPPVIDHFFPILGQVGSIESLFGHNFTGTTSVRFNTEPSGFVIVNDSLIRATVPPAASDGPLIVTNPAGADTSAESFILGLAGPSGINLSWRDCGLSGVATETFACDTNAGLPFVLVASFRPPPSVVDYLGLAAQIDVRSLTPALPDWWKFGSGFCRGTTAFAPNFNFTSGPFTCADFFDGQAAGGYAYDVGFSTPDRGRLRVQAAVPVESRGPIDPTQEYYAFKVLMQRSQSSGGGSCAGCSTPACIVLNSLQLFQSLELSFDPIITDPVDRNFVIWQATTSNCPSATAALVSAASIDFVADRVRVVWHTNEIEAARVERRDGAGPWSALATVAVDGAHRVVYEDANVVAGGTYTYRLAVELPGGSMFGGETSIEIPTVWTLAIESVAVDAGVIDIALSLPNAGPAQLEIFDLVGRRRAQHRVERASVGAQRARVPGASSLESGVYFVRLTQNDRRVTHSFIRRR